MNHATSAQRINEQSLLNRILARSQLRRSWERVYANRGMAGVDKITLPQFAANLETNLATIAREVRTGSYRPRDPLFVRVQRGHKQRVFAIPAVRDRVLQRATLDVVAPLVDQHFAPTSFGYRSGRGVAQAIERVIAHRHQGLTWVVDADIEDCFGSLDHALLRRSLRGLIPDREVCQLLEMWIAVYHGGKGIPLGAVVAPFFCNLYLHHLDLEFARRGFRSVRYADDFIVLSPDPADAGRALATTHELLSVLKLRLNRHKTHIVTFDAGFTFLGYRFWGTRQPIAIRQTDEIWPEHAAQRTL